jgi:predicted MFS family arabinose efflux permease
MWLLRNSYRIKQKGLWFMCGLITGTITQMLIGPATNYWYLAVIMFVWGLTGGFYLNLNQSMIQRNTPQEVMGRVMSVHSLMMVGLAPMASLLVGYVARHFDAVPATVSVTAAMMLVLILVVLVTQRDFRSTP